jgi:hypothetical protein
MRHISEVGSRELCWTSIGCAQREYELRADGEVVACLHRQGGSFGVAETANGSWSFERPGLRRSRVNVREAASGSAVANFGSGWTGEGVLETSQRKRFGWTPANFWRSRWEWRGAYGTPLVRFWSRQGLTRAEGRARIEGASVILPELDLLVALGWYLIVMRARDATSDAVAATAGTAGP